ncbi:MAG: RDD family protein [Nocardioides sp.]|nr:RDD family protein [Nocardioides sp.]
MQPAFETTTWARRALALGVDWVASTLVVIVLVGGTGSYYGTDSGYSSLYTLGVFVVESAVLTGLAGGSFGQLATRLRVVREDGDPRPVDLLRAFARQILVALVIPPLVFRPDGRGLHDIAAGTATVDLPTFLALRGAPREAP